MPLFKRSVTVAASVIFALVGLLTVASAQPSDLGLSGNKTLSGLFFLFNTGGGGAVNDAGGLVLTVEDGKVVVKRVPGWNPEILGEVNAAITIMNKAAAFKDKHFRQQLEQLAQTALQNRNKEIAEYMREAGK